MLTLLFSSNDYFLKEKYSILIVSNPAFVPGWLQILTNAGQDLTFADRMVAASTRKEISLASATRGSS